MILIFLGYIRSETIQAQEKVVIGEMQDNKPVVTMSLDLIKYNLEGYLKANEAKSVLTEITIKYSGNTYVLYACNKFKTIKTIVKLELIEGKFYESVETCGGSLVVSCKSTSKIDYEPEVKPLSAFLRLPVYVTGEANDKEEAARILKEKESHYKQKSVSWEYESEYRLMLQPPIPWLFGEHFDYTQQERLFHYQPSQLVGIIYGARMEVTEKNRIKEILKESRDWLSYSAMEKTIEFNFVEFEANLATNQRKVEIIPTGLMTYHTIPVSDPDFNRLYQEWQDGWGWERHDRGSRKIKVD